MPFDFPEYAQFTGVSDSMFKDLAPEFDMTSIEERFPSEIPGVVLVRKEITVAAIENEHNGSNRRNSPPDPT